MHDTGRHREHLAGSKHDGTSAGDLYLQPALQHKDALV